MVYRVSPRTGSKTTEKPCLEKKRKKGREGYKVIFQTLFVEFHNIRYLQHVIFLKFPIRILKKTVPLGEKMFLGV